MGVAEIVQLLTSGHHRYAGRPTDDLPEAPDETVGRIEVRAGLGIVGDRYFNRPAHRDASVTVIAIESLARFERPVGLLETRRNILLRGVDVDAHIGAVLSLDSGDGPVLLRLHRAANPCRWLDFTIADGAWKALRGHGGVRSEPLTDGVLRLGPVDARWTTG
jgi:MOSC domain-containing protein YiiM